MKMDMRLTCRGLKCRAVWFTVATWLVARAAEVSSAASAFWKFDENHLGRGIELAEDGRLALLVHATPGRPLCNEPPPTKVQGTTLRASDGAGIPVTAG